MKKVTLLILLLCGCANRESPLAYEMAGWYRAKESSQENCFNGKNEEQAAASITRKNIKSYASCMDEIESLEVEPVVVYPDLYAQYKLGDAENIQQYASGKVSKDIFLARNKANFSSYLQASSDRLARAFDAQSSRQQAMSATLLGLGAQYQSLAIQQQNTYRPVNTTCFNNPMGMNCTTY